MAQGNSGSAIGSCGMGYTGVGVGLADRYSALWVRLPKSQAAKAGRVTRAGEG